MVQRSKIDSVRDKHSAKRLVARSIDVIRLSLSMDLLTQCRGTGIGDVVVAVGTISIGYTASIISSTPSAPMTQVIDPIVNDWPGSGRTMELRKVDHLAHH